MTFNHRSDPGLTIKPVISLFFGSFTVPVFKTMFALLSLSLSLNLRVSIQHSHASLLLRLL